MEVTQSHEHSTTPVRPREMHHVDLAVAVGAQFEPFKAISRP